VLDDETIDSGVASEIGLAHAAGRAVVGVYTDIRRDRAEGRMYKNLYVLGLIESSLGMVHTKEELIKALAAWQGETLRKRVAPRLMGEERRQGSIDQMIDQLERRYQPRGPHTTLSSRAFKPWRRATSSISAVAPVA